MSSRRKRGDDEERGACVDIGRFLFANLEQRALAERRVSAERRAAQERQPAATDHGWQLAASATCPSYQGTIFTMASLDGPALRALAEFSEDVDTVYFARDARLMAASGEAVESDNAKLVRFGKLYPDKVLVAISLADLANLGMPDRGATKQSRAALRRTIVHLEGGQTFANEELIRNANETEEHTLFPNLERLIANGVRFVGQSAGAITLGMYNTAAFKGEQGDLPAWRELIIAGHSEPVEQASMLGLINACVVPHYRAKQHTPVGREIAQRFHVDTYGIANGGFAIFRYKDYKPFRMGGGVRRFQPDESAA